MWLDIGTPMKSSVRPLLLAWALGVAVYLVPTTNHAFGRAFDLVIDLFDTRPVVSVLMLGNSRTYYNYMPEMVRAMADSAHAPVRYDITTAAWGGATFEELWDDKHVQELLGQHWDHVVLQAESGAHLNNEVRRNFEAFSAKLIGVASKKSPVALIVSWAYSEAYFANELKAGASARQARAWYVAEVQNGYRALAGRMRAELINTGAVWEALLARDASIPLYQDGNHPSVYGSYLSALMIYAFISEKDVDAVTYVPDGLDETTVAKIKAYTRRY